MTDYVVSDQSLTSIANAIRQRRIEPLQMAYPDGFVSAIKTIPHDTAEGGFTAYLGGRAMDIELDHAGPAYPIAVFIYPSEGTYNTSGTFNNMVRRYAIVYWAGIKSVLPSTPTYEGIDVNDQMSCFLTFKNSTTNGRVVNTTSGLQVFTYQNIDASASSTLCVRFKSNKLMSVFIANNSYGFAPNAHYSYTVIY